MLSRLSFVGALIALAVTPARAQPPSPTSVLSRLPATGDPVYISGGPRDRTPDGPDRTLAPYFFVPDGSATERLPLEETRAEVRIAGVITAVRVHQVFVNRGAKPIEAVYVFPASTRAAVHGMRMRIGTRTIEAKLERRAEARAAYQAAKQAGRRASLLEQERANVFTMNVANVMPGDRIQVELDYTEWLTPEAGTYEFVYPAVVGPRYTGGADPARDRWMANPHLPAGQGEPYKFDVGVHLETGIAIKELSSPSHAVDVKYHGTSSADVRLKTPGGGNRDFVLRYRLAGDRIETGAMLWQEPAAPGRPAENFFAVMMQPPRRPADAMVPPREYIFLLDVSGSMHGFPLETAKVLMRNLLGQLRPTDLVNVALFSGASYVWSPKGSRRATAENVREAIDLIQRQNGGGSTELMGGLESVYAVPPAGDGVSRTVVVVTDGYVGVEARAFRFIRERLDQANLFAFGIGSSVNRVLIEGMARAGVGEPFVVLDPSKAPEAAARLKTMIERPVLTDVKVRATGLQLLEVAPGKVPDLLAERPLVVFGKWQGRTDGAIEISGRNGAGPFLSTVRLSAADVRPGHAPLRALWARKWIETLEDEHAMGGGAAVEEAITQLGLGYGLLTRFTSFVAVDSQVVNRGGDATPVRQPLPMPEGVSDMAVASAAPMGVAGIGAAKFKGRAAGAAAPAPILALREAKAEDDALVLPRPEKRSRADVASPQVKLVDAAGVTDPEPLLQAVRALMMNGRCGQGALRLRLTLDQQGRVTGVVIVSGDRRQQVCLDKLLVGLTSAARGKQLVIDVR